MTLDCYTIHYQNCNTYKVGVAVYKTQAFRNLEYNIGKAPADSQKIIILDTETSNLPTRKLQPVNAYMYGTRNNF